MAKLTLFISYVHEDGEIATSVRNAIQSAFGDDVAVFQDKVSLQQGDDIRDTLGEHLKGSDVLVVISTGTERPSHDWAGWELGFFNASHLASGTDPNARRGKIVTFCSARNAPRPMVDKLYIPLDFDANTLDESEKEFAESLLIADDDPIVLWLGELFRTVSGENLADRRDKLASFKRIVTTLKTKVFTEFKCRPKSVLRPQKQLTVRYSLDDDGNPVKSLRETAKITLSGQATGVFGIRGESENTELPWSQFTEMLNANVELGKFWLGTLERLLVSAKDINIDNSQIITSHDQRVLYRVILTSSTTYYNKTMVTSIYLVELYRRRDYGDPATSLLLKGLQIVCRFRFLFLERQSQFHCLNVALAADALTLRSIAARIVAELDILTSDIFQANLHQPASWTAFIDGAALIEMNKVWEPLRVRLLDCCAAVISSPDGTVDSAKQQLSEVLKAIQDQCGPYNERLLRAMATKLMEYSKIDRDVSAS